MPTVFARRGLRVESLPITPAEKRKGYKYRFRVVEPVTGEMQRVVKVGDDPFWCTCRLLGGKPACRHVLAVLDEVRRWRSGDLVA